VIDLTRRGHREDARGDMGDGADARSLAAAPDDALHDRRSEAALWRDLLRLPPAQRDAFELLKLEGLSVAECAEVLGITQGMVKIRAHRATVALRGAHLRRERILTVLENDGRDARDEEVPP
jgi:RNA polymerase sigma-70 factor (ECF subfamily)